MRTITNTVALLLVDVNLGGSGPSDLSEWLVKQRVAQTVSIVTSTVHRHNGIVATRFGHTLLCTFPKAPAAVKAAQDILASVRGADGDASITANRKKVDLRLVINFGRLTVAAGNISGDVVDLVSGLASMVEQNTIIATREVIDALPAGMQEEWSDRGDTKVEGLPAPVRTYQLAAGPEAAPDAAPAPHPAPAGAPAPGMLIVAHGEQQLVVDENSPSLRIGRARDNDLVVAASHVSRNHATIERRDDGFYLVNLSVNGTTIVTETGPVLVGPEQMLQLTGTGQLALAPAAHLAEHPPIVYRLQ